MSPRHPLQVLAPQYQDFLSKKLYPETGDQALLSQFFKAFDISGHIHKNNIEAIGQSLTTVTGKVKFLQEIFQKLYMNPEEQENFKECAKVLKTIPIIVATNKTSQLPTSCFLPTKYNPHMDVMCDPHCRANLKFVSLNYPSDDTIDDWRKFFLALGVKDRIEVIFTDILTTKAYRENLLSEMQETGLKQVNEKIDSEDFNYVIYLWKQEFAVSSACTNKYAKVPHPDSFKTIACPPTEGWRFSSYQHSISPLIWIKYFFLIRGSLLFWQLIKDNWEPIKQKSTELVTYKTYCSFREKGIPSTLEFYAQNSVPADNGKSYSPSNIYSPKLRSLTKGILPAPVEALSLTDEQIEYFKFKQWISFDDCLRLLAAFQETPEDPELENKIAQVYLHMLKSEKCEISSEIMFLNEKGAFCAKTSLVGNCVEGLSFTQNAGQILKRPQGVNIKDYTKICELLDISQILPQNLHIDYSPKSTPDELQKSSVIRRLPFLYVQKLENTSQQCSGDANSKLFEQMEENARIIQELEFIVTAKISVATTVKGVLFQEPVFAWIQDSKVFGVHSFSNPSTNAHLAHQLHIKLNLECSSIELAHLLASSEEDIKKEYDYKEKSELYLRAEDWFKKLEETLQKPKSKKPEEPEISSEESSSSSSDKVVETPAPSPKQNKRAASPERTSKPYTGGHSSGSNRPSGNKSRSKVTKVSTINYPRKAEEAVFDYFKDRHDSQEVDGKIIYLPEGKAWDKVHIQWMNAISESYNHFDIRKEYFKGGALVKAKYIEVKSKSPGAQSDPASTDVTLSLDETGLMEDSERNYSLWIVKFSSPEKFTLHKLKHPNQHIKDKTISHETVLKPQLHVTIPYPQLSTKTLKNKESVIKT